MKCELDFFHMDDREANSHVHLHAHTGYELVYYENGHGQTRIENHTFSYQPGQFSIIQPGCKHDEFRETTTHVLFLVFFYDNFPIVLRNGLYTDLSNGRISQLLHKISAEILSKTSFYDILIRCYLAELIVEVGRTTGEQMTTELDDKVIYAKHYIEQYAADKINLPGLAKTLGYSYDYFRHLFKTSSGYSPMQYIVQQRIGKAKQQLTESNKSITSIALECGFSNAPQFCSMFKKQIGVSPMQYRQG